MGIKERIMNFIKINGITHQVGVDQVDHVEIKENKVFIDDKEITKITEKHVTIEWVGSPPNNITLNRGDLKCEDVQGSVYAEGNIECGSVRGDLEAAGGNITCKDVGGNVEAGENIVCGNVTGSAHTEEGNIQAGNIQEWADAGGNINCGNVGDYVDSGGDVTCGDVGGYVEAEDGNVICKAVSGDINADTVKVVK